MAQVTSGHPGTPTERNAFPVGRSIFAGILTLIVVRYLFGLIPLSYPITAERAEFYYKGQVLSISPPNGFCYQNQRDIVENALQLVDFIIHYDQPKTFVTFRTYLPCDEIYTRDHRIFGYQKFLTRAFYEDGEPSLDEIGFVGVSSQLLPTSPGAVSQWLDSDWKKSFTAASMLPPIFAPYFEEHFDFSLSLQAEGIATRAWPPIYRESLGMGYCSAAIGHFLELDDEMASSPPDRWEGMRNNFKDELRSGRAKRGTPIMLSLYVTSIFGRAVYFGSAKRAAQASDMEPSSKEIIAWSVRQCRQAALSLHEPPDEEDTRKGYDPGGATQRPAEPGIIGIDRN